MQLVIRALADVASLIAEREALKSELERMKAMCDARGELIRVCVDQTSELIKICQTAINMLQRGRGF